MRFKIDPAHTTFFQQNGFIEFEEALGGQEELLPLLEGALKKRLTKDPSLCSAEELYRAGRDLWRTSKEIQKKVFSHPLAEIAAQLFNKKTLLIGFDQLLKTTQTPGFPGLVAAPLHAYSSIQPLAGALLLHLAGDPTPSPFIPRTPQHVLALSPTLPIPWEIFFQTPHQTFLLIAYASPESLYVHEKKDLHLHALKKMGYGYGDRLRHEHHPIVCR